MSRARISLAALCILLFATGFFVVAVYVAPDARESAAQSPKDSLRTITVAGNTVRVGVADTPAARKQGLSGRPGLAPDEGLLFVFEKEGTWGFWMKDMRFSIDIVWVGKDGRVVFTKERATPESYPEAFVPPAPALYVVELPEGYCASHNVHIGSIVSL